MKYAIVENEVPAANHIKSMIGNLRPDWELSFCADSVKGTIANIDACGLPDLMFLDIELNDGNIFELFTEREISVPVVFTTAYDEYCLQAFKVNSVDYVMKPVSMEDLLFAIRKFETSSLTTHADDVYSQLADYKKRHQAARILISNKDSYGYISSDEVAWFKSEDKCQFLFTTSGARHITTFASLNDIEEILPADQFFRVSRSFLVNINAIQHVKKSFNYKLYIVVKAGEQTDKIIISVAKKKEFLNWYGRG